MADTRDARRVTKVAIIIGAITGIVVAFAVMPPLAGMGREWLGLPKPTAAPLDYPQSRPLIPTYWQPWLVAWILLIAPGIALLIPARTRYFGSGYGVAFGAIGGMVGLVAAWFTWALG